MVVERDVQMAELSENQTADQMVEQKGEHWVDLTAGYLVVMSDKWDRKLESQSLHRATFDPEMYHTPDLS